MRTHRLMQLSAMVCVLGIGVYAAMAAAGSRGAGQLQAQDSQNDQVQTVEGKVTQINQEDHTFVLMKKAVMSQELTFTISDETEFVIGDKEVKQDEVLRDDAEVSVTHRDNIALKVAAIQ